MPLKLFKSQKKAHATFQKPKECPPLFSQSAREFQYVHEPKGKTAQKIRERIQPIEKRNQSADNLALFENSNEIQKLFAYPA